MVSVYSTIGSEEQQRTADFVKLSGFTEKYSGFDWFLRIESLKNSLQRLLPIRRFIGGGSKTVGSGFKSLCPCQNHRTVSVRWFYFSEEISYFSALKSSGFHDLRICHFVFSLIFSLILRNMFPLWIHRTSAFWRHCLALPGNLRHIIKKQRQKHGAFAAVSLWDITGPRPRRHRR